MNCSSNSLDLLRHPPNLFFIQNCVLQLVLLLIQYMLKYFRNNQDARIFKLLYAVLKAWHVSDTSTGQNDHISLPFEQSKKYKHQKERDHNPRSKLLHFLLNVTFHLRKKSCTQLLEACLTDCHQASFKCRGKPTEAIKLLPRLDTNFLSKGTNLKCE